MKHRDTSAGFSLVEVIVSISLLLVVIVSATPLIINGINFSTEQQRHQSAVIVAQEAMEEVRARSASLTTVNPLVAGRHAADVTAQFNRLSSHAGVPQTLPAADSAAGVGSVAAKIPLTKTVERDGTTFTVETLIGSCTLQKVGGQMRCLTGGTGSKMARAVVVTSWGASSACETNSRGYCSFELINLINLDTDLEWSDAG